ncbi:MAG: DUF6435 family protein [Bacteriovoracaceae bacterium]
MFNFLKSDPVKKLQKSYESKMKEAMDAQRNGDIDRFSTLSQEADLILKEIDQLKKSS